MCDMFVVMPESSDNRKLWFAKNSDRSPNEPNLIINQPAEEHNIAIHPNVDLTYISIPQAMSTNALLMVKPSWTWGCEMGINEHGLLIGNEAVFTKGKYAEKGLIGMDLCRLVLERCTTAFEAMQMIGSLLETYGQGGNCGFDSDFFYDNSFLVADCAEAYVVETADRLWIAKKVEGVYAISNMLTIEGEWDYCCDALKNAPKKLNFSKKYSDSVRTSFGGGSLRRYSIYQVLLNARDGEPQKNAISFLAGNAFMKRGVASGIDYSTCKAALRTHLPNGGYTESPCMHYGGIIGSHTTGSLIACPEDERIGITGGSTPCRAIYMPFSLKGDLPFGNDPVEAERYWLKRELIQRNLLSGRIDSSEYQRDASEVEKQLESIARSSNLQNATKINHDIYERENSFVSRYLEQCSRNPEDLSPRKGSIGYKKRWNNKNRILLDRMKELGL